MRILAALTTALLLMFSTPALCEQIVYDPAYDFTLCANPSGVWTYGRIASGQTVYVPYDRATVSNLGYMQNANPNWSGAGGLWTDGSVMIIPKGTIIGSETIDSPTTLLHPPNTAGQTILRFTAPTAGTFTLKATFSSRDPNARLQSVRIAHGAETLLAKDLNGFGASATANTTLVLTAGDTVDFIVTNGDGNFWNDGAFLEASLTRENRPSTCY